MIKKILVAALIALPMMASAQKFGIVNIQPVLESMPERATIEQQLKTASDTYQTEFKNLQDELDKKYSEFQKLDADPTTPQSIKERRMQEIQELSQKAQQFAAQAQTELQRQQAQLMAPVEEKIMNAIKAVGQEGGFTFIFPEGVGAYTGNDVIDVTPLVKTKLGLK